MSGKESNTKKATKSVGKSLEKSAKQAEKAAKKALKAQSWAGASAPSSVMNEPEELEELEIETTVSRETLESTPMRCLQFLKAVGTSAAIRGALATRGYAQDEHLEGWGLLHAASGFQQTTTPVEDTSVRDAIQLLDAWDEDGFRIIAVSLRHRFPEQAAFLLDGVSASTGAAAVLGVKRLLDRLDALENAPDRQSCREADHAALNLLAKRGIDERERSRLRLLVTKAESAPDVSLPNAADVARADASYLRKLVALRAWYEEWAAIAKVAVKRRDYLIRMGLARKHTRADETTTQASNSPAAIPATSTT
jgi:hypothetical protein